MRPPVALVPPVQAGPEAVERDLTWHLALIAAMRMEARRLEEDTRDAVLAARDVGASWDAVGRALGVSRQAAVKRYGGQLVDPG